MLTHTSAGLIIPRRGFGGCALTPASASSVEIEIACISLYPHPLQLDAPTAY
jgi:hypothetical protein